jgi:putative transposase
VTSPNKLWVSDITYIDMKDNVCYLHLVTDAYSRKIIGWKLAPGLHSAYTVQALEMAIAGSGKDDLERTYPSLRQGHTVLLRCLCEMSESHHIAISMTQDYKPTDNAVAERVNGILKGEWLDRREKFADMKRLKKRWDGSFRSTTNEGPI